MATLIDTFFPRRSATSNGDSQWWPTNTPATSAGIRVNATTAKTLSAVAACSRLLSATCGMLPWVLMRSEGRKTVKAFDHPLYDLLFSSPNEEMGSMMFRAMGVEQQVNAGNFIAEIQTENGRPARDGGRIVAMWPIHVSRVEQLRDAISGGLFYRVRNDDHSTTDLYPNEVFHVPSMDTVNGTWGIGIVSKFRALEAIGYGAALQQHGSAYFGNNGRPGVIIKNAQFKNADDRQEFRRQWLTVHGGPGNSNRPAVLPPGADVSFLTISNEDGQYLQSKADATDDICRWYNIPPHMVQKLDRATFSNIEHQGIQFVVYSLLPWLKLWEEEVGRKLLTKTDRDSGYFCKFNVNALLRGDYAARAAFYKALFDMASLSPNDIRELEDLNPVEGGDTYFVPGNNLTPLRKVIMGHAEWSAAREKDDVTRDEFRQAILSLPPSENGQEASLISVVGGMTGSVEISRAVGEGKITQDAAAELLSLFLKIPRDQAVKIAGEAMAVQPEPQEESEIPPEGDLEETSEAPQGTLQDAKYVCRLWLAETMRRMLNKEIKDVKRAAAKPREFLAWLDRYYDEWAGTLADALRGPLALMSVDHVAFAKQHAEDSKKQLLDAADGDPEQFTARVETVCDGWGWRIERASQ